MKKIRVGLIGAGWIAAQHMKVINDLAEEVEASGVYSRTFARAETFAKDYSIRLCARSIEELIEGAHPDALLVLVSEDQTEQVVRQLIERYKLPLFIEKPAGLTPEQNKALADLAKRHAVRNMVGFNRRYYSIFHKGLDIIRQNGLLRGVMVEGHERMWRVRKNNKFSETVLANWIYANSTHTIDLLRFFGGEPLNISSISHSHIEKKGDQIAAIMEFDGGAIGNYSAHWYSPGGWRAVLYGDGVTVEFKPLESGRWLDKDFKATEIVPDDTDVAYKPGFYGQMKAFANLVRGNKPDPFALDLEGAYKTMLLAKELCFSEGK